ncbi:hypothetical protein E2566_15900 [Pectobacterium punjabense]|uniref:Addiction module toxin RelE n=1 Tax=Pectobacterium punjabense TaxID=2108399 RepID=A0ABX6L4U3_9GAMM|nr:hypothetical protein C9I36_19390 [Pectobacterium punjabense]QJA21297.1 hypothetical protein E2566_15900 [Pectobacterium punjabense]
MKPDSQCQRLNPLIRLTAEKDAKGKKKQAAISVSYHHKYNKKLPTITRFIIINLRYASVFY